MPTLTKRIHTLFDQVIPYVDMVVLYFKRRNTSGLSAAIFWRDFRDPKIITVNKMAFQKLQKYGQVFEFHPDVGFFLGSSSKVLEPKNDTPEMAPSLK